MPTIPIIDMHTHAGLGAGEGDRRSLAGLGTDGMAAAVSAAIADGTVIRRNAAGTAIEQFREPGPGECLRATEAHLDVLAASGVAIAREPADIAAGRPSLVLAVEGCDFLEGDLDRLDALAARGVRSIQPVHYRVNELGDIQTAPPRNGGLTAFGRDAVRRMAALGIMVDVAHCTEATARGVAEAHGGPILCTHANLKDPDRPDGDHPRFLSPDYARMVAATGGVVGAWIAVLWEDPLDNLIRHLFRLIDAIGVDHVGIGTDMPLGAAETAMPDFSHHAALLDAMQRRGMTGAEVAKVAGGNWLRVFTGTRAAAGLRSARRLDRAGDDRIPGLTPPPARPG